MYFQVRTPSRRLLSSTIEINTWRPHASSISSKSAASGEVLFGMHVKQTSADNAVSCALCAVKTDAYLKHISLTSGELVLGGSKALPVWAPSLHLCAVYLIAYRPF